MPRAACPVKCEAYFTRVRGEHHFEICKKAGVFTPAFFVEGYALPEFLTSLRKGRSNSQVNFCFLPPKNLAFPISMS